MFCRRHEELSDPFGRPGRLANPLAACFEAETSESGGGGGSEDAPAASADEDDAHTQKLVAESRKYRKRAQQAEARLRQLEPRVLSEEELAEYRRLKARQPQREQAELTKAREYEKLAAELTERHARELAQANQRGEALEAQLRKVVGTDRLKSALAGRGVTRVDQAAYLLRRHIRVELADGEPVVRVLDKKGRPIIDPACGDGETITIERFVDAWLASEGAHFLPPSGDTGSGAHAGGSADKADIAELEADPAKRYAFIREHGTDEYLRRLGEWKRRQAARK
jgi:hypothetical protein